MFMQNWAPASDASSARDRLTLGCSVVVLVEAVVDVVDVVLVLEEVVDDVVDVTVVEEVVLVEVVVVVVLVVEDVVLVDDVVDGTVVVVVETPTTVTSPETGWIDTSVSPLLVADGLRTSMR